MPTQKLLGFTADRNTLDSSAHSNHVTLSYPKRPNGSSWTTGKCSATDGAVSTIICRFSSLLISWNIPRVAASAASDSSPADGMDIAPLSSPPKELDGGNALRRPHRKGLSSYLLPVANLAPFVVRPGAPNVPSDRSVRSDARSSVRSLLLLYLEKLFQLSRLHPEGLG